MTLFAGTSPQVTLTAQSAINTNGVFLDNGRVVTSHSLQVNTGAGVSGGVVSLQVSLDGTNWFTTTATITTSAASTCYMVGLTAFPAQYVRATISTGITGGTVSALVASA